MILYSYPSTKYRVYNIRDNIYGRAIIDLWCNVAIGHTPRRELINFDSATVQGAVTSQQRAFDRR